MSNTFPDINLIWTQYLDTLDPELLRQRIGQFWKHNFARMQPYEIHNAINDVLTVDGHYIIPAKVTTIPPGTELLRVRHVPRDFVPKEPDCWAPPTDKARNNRLNKDGDPWLYTSLDLGSIFSEMPIPCDKIAMVMVYKVREEMKCSCPLFDGDDLGINLTRRARNRLNLATQFLRDLFSLEVDEGKEYLYKITQTLVTDLVDYPNCVGVLYPGVQAYGYHVAIKGPYQHRIQLSSVKMIGAAQVQYSEGNKKFEVVFQLIRSYDQNLVENTGTAA